VLLGRGDAVGCLDNLSTGRRGTENAIALAERHGARFVRRLTGSVSPIRHRQLPQDDPPRRRPLIQRATDLFGWYPEIGVQASAELVDVPGARDRLAVSIPASRRTDACREQ
jgi:hypothetical protein